MGTTVRPLMASGDEQVNRATGCGKQEVTEAELKNHGGLGLAVVSCKGCGGGGEKEDTQGPEFPSQLFGG